MKIYLLERKENCPDSGLGGYDQYDGFVVCAESAAKARELAIRKTGTNYKANFEDRNAESVWKNPDLTSCALIGRAVAFVEPRIILSNYHAG